MGAEKFSKGFKKSIKITILGKTLKFFIIFHENFATCKIFQKFTRMFRENLAKNLEKITRSFVGGSGSPRTSEFIKKNRRKTNGSRECFENFHKLGERFDFQKEI